ncbi:MAG: hypothetical protein SPI20_06410 [Ruminococcus callidus]|nr:hypothetical protein [Ruminococcus sp.]MDD6376114.1 hypothetical protein [Ruminococcus sp.]MDD6947234.1 hypothetical protein [Ruminococcus sp.]MDY6145322.1 hypothetical protein [Ruminococcus callidus]
MKKRALICLMALLCAASVTGCGNDTAEEKSGDSEVLMVDADQTTAETTATTEADEETTTEAEETTDEDASTKTTAKTTGTKKSSNKKSTTVKKTAGAASDSDEEDADAADEETDSEDTVQDDDTAEEPEISGEAIMALGEDCTQYVRQYPCLSMSEGISCMGDGYDRTYDYGDYIVYTFADRAKTGDYVQEIDLVTDAYSTNAGIHVGSTREEVEAAYGVSDNDQYGSSEGGYFAFLYDGDVVSLIMYCLD